MAKSPARLGKMQLRIMQILWREGQATARQITDELNRSEPVSHSTVQTLLRKMELKGALTHEENDRVFLFRPLYLQEEVAQTAAHDLLTRVFDGSVYGVVSHFLKHETLSPEEKQRLRELIEQSNEEKRSR
ncbi:MAG TPA: BlaI/MecI/CopY family transcriptional regulator [Armatimonadota bacterium]|nr:BlaI/MecI/CopY family transcriptional regulator [Armatimonadota bacterium]